MPNAALPSVRTELGIEMDVSLVSKNTDDSIAVTPSGIVTDVNPVKANADEPIVVTVLGIVTDVKFDEYIKALPSIAVTPSGIATDVKPVVPNAQASIVSTLVGIVTDVKRPSLLKALFPIAVTPSGIVAEPTQSLASVTTLLAIVNVPPPLQGVLPSVTAEAGALRERGREAASSDAMPTMKSLRTLRR